MGDISVEYDGSVSASRLTLDKKIDVEYWLQRLRTERALENYWKVNGRMRDPRHKTSWLGVTKTDNDQFKSRAHPNTFYDSALEAAKAFADDNATKN